MKTTKLIDVADIIYGYAFNSKLFNTSGEGRPLIRIRDVNTGFSNTYTTENAPEKYLVRNGDFLIGMDGNFEIVKWANGEALLNQRVCKIIPKSIKPDYLFYLLSPILKSIENKTHSTTVKHLSAKELNKISFELPNGDQQSKIANELSNLHRMLTLKREALEGLDSLVKSRFNEMFRDPILNDKNWPTSAMSDCCQMKGTKSIPRKEKYWLLNLDKIKSETGEILGKDYVVRDEVGSSTFFFDKNYVLYSKLRPYLNKVIISDESGFATSELVPLKPGACLNSYYLAFLLRSKSFVNWIDSTSSGAKMPRASMSALRSFRVPLPPLELQNKFADFVHLIDKSRFVVHSRYFLWLNFTFVSSTIAYSRVVSILECPKRC